MTVTTSGGTKTTDLAARMKSGDEHAYVEFAEFFGARFARFFRSCDLSASDAEELAITSIIEIALKVHLYSVRPNATFESWVWALARHELADWRRQRKAALSETTYLDELSYAQLPMAPAPERELSKEQAAIHEAVAQAMNRLTERDREMLYLHVVSGYAQVEIAAMFNVRPETVRVACHRGKKLLRRILENDQRIPRHVVCDDTCE